jgi:hypothetical protein
MHKTYSNQKQKILYSYLAGIVDGEGTIGIGKGGSTKYYARISVANVNKEVIDLLAKIFGSKTRLEKINIPNRQPIYRWGTSGNLSVPKIIKYILPYLIIKRKQAEIVLKFCAKENWRQRLNKTCKKCKKTKKQLAGYGLCRNCYTFLWRHKNLEKYKKNYVSPKIMPNLEIQSRKSFYKKARKLNAVGATANN